MTKKQIEKKANLIAKIEKELSDVANDYALDYNGREFDIAFEDYCDGADWVLSLLKEGGEK